MTTNLPIQLDAFVGRTAELQMVTSLLLETTCRLLTLTGPGGTGKTRLSLQLAQELLEQYRQIRADSVAWVSKLQDQELEITGRHPFLQMTAIREMIKMLYIHNLTHYRDMKKAIRT